MSMEASRKFKINRASIIILIVTLTSLAAIGFYSRRESSPRARQQAGGAPAAFVRVETVSADKIVRDRLVQNMSVEAVKRVQIYPRVTGRLERLHVSQGEKVKAGQLVATLEHEQQTALIGAAQAQLASAKAESERANAEMMNAKTNLDRYARLVKEGFSTQ